MANPIIFSKPWFQKRNSSNSVPASNFTEVHFANSDPVSGYYGFKFYFPVTDDADVQRTLRLVYIFENYIARNEGLFSFPDIEKKRSFFVDYKVLTKDVEFLSAWDDFSSEILQNSEFCLSCMSLAMHQTLVKKFEATTADNEQIDGYNSYICNVKARLYNVEPILQLKNLKTNYYGKLVAVRGTAVKIGIRKLICKYLTFKCKLCSGTQVIKQLNWEFTQPTKCPTKGCRSQSGFSPVLSSSYTITADRQILKIQELVQDSQSENGRVPRTYECELTEDLLNCCVPGDDITITGLLKRRTTTESSKSKAKQAPIFTFYLDAISVLNNKNQSQAGQITFNTVDYYAIKKIHEEPHLFRFLVQSFCPVIYGHEITKAGLLLAIFGGSDDCRYDIRSLSHVLMVGDPGIGKSQMLQACTMVAPRGVYVCGKASTSSGLTVCVTRDAGGEYALEAGALVLADQGICCIDEFDKIPAQHESLLEAMEQQSISIAKAGIICTLPTRATILAAANPTGGHYNKSKTIAENLKIRSAMLSRFDLIFILLDRPDSEFDELLPQHVLRLHMDPKCRQTSEARSSKRTNDNRKLRDRLRVDPDEHRDPLPHLLLRKYIAYAQKYVKPTLCDDTKKVLKEFYLGLRKQFTDGGSTPVTVRQLHSLIRLTQARAKMELREQATKEDAADVIKVVQFCLAAVHESDGNGSNCGTQSTLKSTSRNQFNKFLRLVQKSAEEEEKRVFSLEELEEFCECAGIAKDKVKKTIDTLNCEGYFLYKGAGNYQLASTSSI